MTEKTRRRIQRERIARNQERRGWKSRRGHPVAAHSLDVLYPRVPIVTTPIPLEMSTAAMLDLAPLRLSWWSRLVYWVRNL